MFLWVLILAAVAGIVAFFMWTSGGTAKTHARFQASDVEEALAELVSPDARDHDTWDMFLAWPIDDPHLESIRQECLKIVAECPRRHPGEDISEEGVNRVTTILRELRGHGSS